MTFRSTVTVEFGDKAGLFDISDRVQAANCTFRVRTGDFGLNRAILTIRNDDGALTPGAGGTYDGVDWFSQALFITGTTGTYNYDLFHGVITRFDLQDDGISSVVTIEADDGYSVGGGSATDIDIPNLAILAGYNDYWIETLYNGYSGAAGTISGVQMPLLGNTAAEVEVTSVGILAGVLGYAIGTRGPYEETQPVRDFVRTVLMANSPNVAWPTTIDLSTSTTTYNAAECNVHPVRDPAAALNFVFDENPASGELPFFNLRRGFPVDDLLNTAVITTIPDASATIRNASSVNTASTEKYGTRAIQATQVMRGATFPTDTGAMSTQNIADRWAYTYSGSEFTVKEFAVNESMVVATVGNSATSEQAWAQLLDVTTGPVQNGEVTFTPAGSASSVTEQFVVLSRNVVVTPADIRLTVEVLPLDRTGVFVLDSNSLGILDYNRLG